MNVRRDPGHDITFPRNRLSVSGNVMSVLKPDMFLGNHSSVRARFSRTDTEPQPPLMKDMKRYPLNRDYPVQEKYQPVISSLMLLNLLSDICYIIFRLVFSQTNLIKSPANY